MKKFFAMLAIAGILVSCGGKKKADKPAEGDTTTTTTNTTTPTNSGDNTTPVNMGTPAFGDAEVQKYVDDYTAFVNGYLDAVKGKDMTKIQELSMKASEWTNRSMEISKKLAASPDDAKKFTDFMSAMSQKWTDAAKELMPKM
jgi:hypothetical protein